ncbi:MAG: Rrf2 family transcriptional regulator [Candidatus Marinimicrobia bacterium]|jgi:Rrf2 family protein|nr:Rrf2 family transcriptional regulator [Candidatus Neomarinimicrobiota bacterium]MDD9887922.1 Rrf2 family transcriptional regulator [Candidatus Neomarinimicrobiota bacterium]MDD9931831.1 Rrf2 family transcriptional regulator [Candidatus Neomarinimicrobiota bacterium]MDP6628378.1 Rrf2 family transcriptional regulator [Candidatus Neomarinimicrobiota bacterium]MDP6992694.1 Rrf2 family transcriptional regulator [Candidatus Neomarinimicrobiota bacterium]|tara:strand:+ start:121 stop:519 length:399 start_codon:yes stop_codon:yes gene_type:complete
MLKITRKVEYALIALRHMQSKNVDELTSAKEIANQYGIPQQLLAKTLQQMARDRILEAVQGPAGGYRILAKLDRISLKDFFEKLEGPLGMMDCYFESDCIQISACNIRVPIQRINDNLRNMFTQMTLQEVTQ